MSKKMSKTEQALLSERSKKYDSEATKNDIIQDVRNVQEKHPSVYVSRTFYRIHGKYSDATWNSKFGTWAEVRRQAKLELNRHQARLEKDIALHASRDIFRDFYEEEVEPWIGAYQAPADDKRFKKVLVCSDLHDKQLDPFCWSVFLDTAKRAKPDIICLAGDVFDMSEFSRFDQDPRDFSIKESFDFVKEKIFKPLREACPDAQIDFVIGNHDFRILKYLANKTPNMKVLLSDVLGLTMADLFGLPKYKINLVSRFDFAAHTPAEIREEIKNNFVVYYDCLVVDHHGVDNFGMSGCSGHTHRTHMKSGANLCRGPLHWVTMGTMAKIDFAYQERLNKSHQSFCLWHIDLKTKQCQPEHCVFTDESIVVGGKYYIR